MQPVESGEGQARGTLSTPSDNVTPEEPMREAVRVTLLVGLPFFAINAVVKSILIYSVFSSQEMKKFRICLLLRFLAILDCLLMMLLFGLPWLGLLLPLSSDLDYDSRGKLCVVAIYLKMTLVDLVTFTMLLAGLERLHCLDNKPYRSYFAIAFVSQHQYRVHNIFARLLLVVFVLVSMALNLPFLCGNWPTSTRDIKLGECLNPWRILDDDDDAALIRSHTQLGSSVAFLVLLMGWGLKFPKPRAGPRATKKIRKLVRKEVTTPQKKTSFSHPAVPSQEGETTDTQPILPPPAGRAPAALASAANFFKIYLTVQMCKIRGREVGFHLVSCDKSAVPTRKRDSQFDNMVLGYALIYLIFQTIQSIGSMIAAPENCDQPSVMALSVVTDIIAGNRPAFVFFLYTFISIGRFGNIVTKILTTVFSCACLRRRSRCEETITLRVVK